MNPSLDRRQPRQVHDKKFVRAYLLIAATYCLIFGSIQFLPILLPDLRQVFVQTPAFATAAGFTLCGIILLLRSAGLTSLSVFGGFFIEYLALVPLAAYAFGASKSDGTGIRFSFLLIAISLQLLGYNRQFRMRSAFVAMGGSTVLAYGLIGLANSVAGFTESTFFISLGFGLVGGYLLLSAWYDPIRSLRPLWFNVAVGLGSLTANLIMWQSLLDSASQGTGIPPVIATAVLYAGLLATACLTMVAHFAQTAHAQAKNLASLNNELVHAYDATLAGWAQALDLRDSETRDHTVRVTELTMALARRFALPEESLSHIWRGALLHDIGKIGIPDSILLKPGPLNEEEWKVMRQHPMHAYNLLSAISYLRPALDIPLYHHEKWDGTGYPDGLQGADIPFAARMFAIIDVWDALINDRPYRAAWPPDKVTRHIRSLSGTHFDPEVVSVFMELLDEESNEGKYEAAIKN